MTILKYGLYSIAIINILYILVFQYIIPFIIMVYNFLILKHNSIDKYKKYYYKLLYVELLSIIFLMYFNRTSIYSIYFSYFVYTLISNSIIFYNYSSHKGEFTKEIKNLIIIKLCIFFIVYIFGFLEIKILINKNNFIFKNNITNIYLKN